MFLEVPQQYDFGKDGYVDFSEQQTLNGLSIAVQVKGGKSYRSASGWEIPAKDRTRQLWFESTVPVFGILWDPEHGLHWINLTDFLRCEGIDAPIRLTSDNSLDEQSVGAFVEAAQRATAGSMAMAALGSTDAELQAAAIWDCFGLGRRDPRYLTLVRRVMFGLDPRATDLAIEALNNCSHNRDNWIDTTWMGLEERASVRESFRWTVDEAVALLDRVRDDENGFYSRASLGSCVYWLLVGDDSSGRPYVDLVEAAMKRAISEDGLHAAAMGLLLWLYWLGPGAASALQDLLELHPGMVMDDEVALIVEHVRVYGSISL